MIPTFQLQIQYNFIWKFDALYHMKFFLLTLFATSIRQYLQTAMNFVADAPLYVGSGLLAGGGSGGGAGTSGSSKKGGAQGTRINHVEAPCRRPEEHRRRPGTSVSIKK